MAIISSLTAGKLNIAGVQIEMKLLCADFYLVTPYDIAFYNDLVHHITYFVLFSTLWIRGQKLFYPNSAHLCKIALRRSFYCPSLI